MSNIVLSEGAAPTTPASGTVKIYSTNDAVPMLATIDDAAIIRGYAGLIYTSTSADFTGTNVNTAQPVFDTTEDTITLPAATSYLLNAYYHIHTTGTTSHTLGLLFGGTATFTNIDGTYWATNQATEVLGAANAITFASAAVVQVSAALASATHHSILITGIIRVNGAGTVIPQYQWSAAPGVAGVTLRGSYFQLTPMGVNTIKAFPPALWS